MSKIAGWSKVDKNTEKWKRYNGNLGSDTGADWAVDVEVWECDTADIDYVVYKTRQGVYGSTLDGDDQTEPPVNIPTGYFGLGEDAITTKKEAIKRTIEILREHPNPLGILNTEDKYKVYEADVGQYSSQGMGAVSYASSEASRLADNLEKELGVETAIGKVEGRKHRSFAEGGSYGGTIPVYADTDIPEDVVRKVKRKHSDYDDFDGKIEWSSRDF